MKEDTLYMLEPGKSVQVPNVNLMEGQTAATKDAIVVFCIDTSGSMGCTTEVAIVVCSVLVQMECFLKFRNVGGGGGGTGLLDSYSIYDEVPIL